MLSVGFVIFWVVLGLIVFFVAMSGGRRGAGKAIHSQTPLANRLFPLAFVVVLAFGLTVPTLVLVANGDNKASVGPGGVHLNANQQVGRDLFSKTCAFCHTLKGADAVGRIGPDLDLYPGLNKALVLNAIQLGRARGNGSMPAELYTGVDANDVASFVAAVAGH
ncbi:MAG TPA: cytochrome c [Solirubrobacteraceae bacterium]|jgi:cytochrome c553|nr:cytochrome c [Solirubrobacteraceae bacterium]